MALFKSKLGKGRWFKLGIAMFFAVLQVLQPFIHAHLDADHPIHATGFHVGADDETYFSAPNIHGVYFAAHASHTVSVDEAIKPDTSAATIADAIGVGLFIAYGLLFGFALQSSRQRFPQASLSHYQSLRRHLPATRAPPQS